MLKSPLLSRVRKDALPAIRRRLRAEESGGVGPEPEVERYAHEVLDWAMRLWRVPNLLATTATLIHDLEVPESDESFGMYTVQSHHLVVHRALMPTARDTALRLVAAVWDLRVPEAALINDRIIYKNGRMTEPVKASLKRFDDLARPHLAERNDILHAGGVPALVDYDWEEHWAKAEAEGKTDEEFFQALAEGAASDRVKIAGSIREDIRLLIAATEQLFAALEPGYVRQRTMLAAAE